jgi:3-oxoacid CoA-transferase A subunit
MAIDKRIASAAAAVADIGDGARVMISGFGGAGFANQLVLALRDHGARDLTLIVNSATHPLSQTHTLIEAGLVGHVICSAARGRGKGLSPFEQLYKEGKIGLTVLPQGTFAECIRAAGAGIPAFYTPSGYGTELAAGKETRRFGERDYVLEEAIAADVALVRADIADRFGNLTFRYAQKNFGPAMATAARVTIAEVRVISAEPIPPERVELPGVYVQRVVQEARA